MSSINNFIKRDFNNNALKYNKYTKLQYSISEKLFNLYSPYITDNAILLDAGCGTGYSKKFIRENNKICKLFEFDISENMCKVTKSSCISEYLDFLICCNIENLPFKKEAFNLYISSMVFQWANIEKSCLEISRILSNEGYFFITLLLKNSLKELRESLKSQSQKERVYSFSNQDYIEEVIAKNASLELLSIKREEIVYYYDSIKDIYTHIKNIGGNYKHKNNSYPGKLFFTNVEKYYSDNFFTDKGFPVTWDIVYLYGKKT